MTTTHLWEPVEIELHAARDHDNPYLNVDVWVDLVGPNFERRCFGFWDGGDTYRVRVVATAPGAWSWTSGCSVDDEGLAGKTGGFEACAWSDAEKDVNPCRRGFLRSTPNGHALQHADGTPFFLLGDTWWSIPSFRWPLNDGKANGGVGPAMGLPDAVAFRRSQGYNCLGIVAVHPCWLNDGKPSSLKDEDGTVIRAAWRQNGTGKSAKDMHDDEGNRPFLTPGRCAAHPETVPDFDRINHTYFRSLDRKIAYLNQQGIVPFVEASRRDVGRVWAKYHEWPTSYVRYLRYLFARLQPYNVIMSPLHLDAVAVTLPVSQWRQAIDAWYAGWGSMPFGQPVSTNINYSTAETWGHGDTAPWLTLHQTGNNPRGHAIYDELSHIHRLAPAIPALNGEPYYAGWCGAKGNTPEDNVRARSAMYGNVLCGGLAGHIYGADGLWGGDIEAEPRDACGTMTWEALKWTSGDQMKHLATFVMSEGSRYVDLEPHRELLEAPRRGDRDYHLWSYCMRTPDRRFYLVYFEHGVKWEAVVDGAIAGASYEAHWFDPRTGEWLDVEGAPLSADMRGRIRVPDRPVSADELESDWGLRLVTR